MLAVSLLVAGCSSAGSDGTKSTSVGSGASTSVTDGPDRVDVDLGVDPDTVVATLDERYSSYNLEMVTVTGGAFWAPYGADEAKADRPPIDLTSTRLRNLARALGPAYIRVSGTWANDVYFDPDGSPGDPAPDGFDGVLTGDQWKGVGDFADAVDAQIVTSYASTAGTRDADGAWLPDQARERMRFDEANEIPVAAAELFNESNLPIGFPSGYDAADFSRDFDAFAELAASEAPDLRLVGPSTANDINPNVLPASIRTEDMLQGMGSKLDVFSYHFYPKSSKRCGGTGDAATGITPGFLGAIDPISAFYGDLHDHFVPDTPIWVTETGQAQCGGDPWASDYVDVIRFVDTLGKLATHDGNAVFHNTLVGSDYAFLSEDGFATRPNYWAAVLWDRLMGPRVLRFTGSTPDDDVTVYAQCSAGDAAGGATYAVLNTSADGTASVTAPSTHTEVYQLTGESLDSPDVQLNGGTLRATDDGNLPTITGRPVTGAVELPPASVTFVVDPKPVAACGRPTGSESDDVG